MAVKSQASFATHKLAKTDCFLTKFDSHCIDMVTHAMQILPTPAHKTIPTNNQVADHFNQYTASKRLSRS